MHIYYEIRASIDRSCCAFVAAAADIYRISQNRLGVAEHRWDSGCLLARPDNLLPTLALPLFALYCKIYRPCHDHHDFHTKELYDVQQSKIIFQIVNEILLPRFTLY